MSQQSKDRSQAGVDAYEQALDQFASAFESLHRGEFDAARAAFLAIAESNPEEPALAERARTYSRVCEKRTAADPAEPTTNDGLYRRGVMLSNAGELDEALRMLDRAVQAEPAAAHVLYARASTYALKGNVEASIGDLRQAIALDPATRFQAVNDPDFEQIREEPAFIDIIEPTPTGA